MGYKITPYVFSPIHIGTGNDIDPFSYIIDKNGDKDAIYRYDFTKLLMLLDDEDFKIIKYLSENPSILNFLAIRKTVGKLLPKYKDAVVSVTNIAKTDFIDDYEDSIKAYKLNNSNAINQLNIAETYRDGGRLTIPGSSVKGAIRTAILQEAREFKDFSSAADDPFNMFSVSDIHFKDDGVNIGYYLNYPANNIPSAIEKSMPSQATEVIKQSQLCLPFDIQIKDYLKNGRNTKLVDIILKCKDKKTLFSIINNHYLWQLKKDYELFKKYAPKSFLVGKLSDGKLFASCEKNTRAFIKVGKHNGALGVTFKSRRIKIKQVKGEDGPKYVEEPGTVWHFSLKNKKNVKPEYLYPSGWLLLT